ncbi:hypothetical protein N7492_008822 [Penicillium capsulatum]|uniref:RRM domain-containing protein n=1 Tax=Penicillium capsulatum TaxID=69766 RepID=A0A9W9HW09_9EURO|nr:hypothetical protein N7492_008822 [Penicillium capsulatum]KAJ6106223.1 hypothetical protein N7512_009740 [Penicillium capsulatum]
MLKPFQVRGFCESSSESNESSTRSGTVQISSTDYDEIASKHPRARLTYLDDDDTDGDQITVGSSLELSQRLDEPLETAPFVFSGPSNEPMHIFDIRRSNSVTELWRRYETTIGSIPAGDDQTLYTVSNSESRGDAETTDVSATSAPGDSSQPLLSAFEAELASIMSSADTSEARVPQQSQAEPATESTRNTNEQRTPHPAELIAAQIMHHLVNGVNMLHSELSTKLPELQRQVRNAQRSLPDQVSTSLQSLLATLEAQMRSAYNNIPNGGRQFAEEAIHAGRPVAENAAESLRMVASEFNEVGRTLFTAFENEFGRMGLQGARNTSNANPVDPGSPSMTEPASSQHTTSQGNDQGQDSPVVVPGPPPSLGSQLPPYYRPLPPAYSQLQRPWVGHVPPPTSAYPFDISNRGHPPLPYLPMNWSQLSSWTYPSIRQPPPASNAQDSGAARPPPLGTATEGANMQSDDLERKTLFIGNVGFNVTESMIRDVFASKGFVVEVVLPLDEPTNKHAGFGYLHFPSIHPATAAMDVLQGAHIDGHAINLEFCDVAPAESLRLPQETSSPSATTGESETNVTEHNASCSKPVVSDEPLALSKTKSSRRKSVTFQEPLLPPKETVPADSKSTNQDERLFPTRADSPPLIDFLAEEATSTAHGTSENGNDDLINFNPEMEMSRFPPVSQIEAQHLSKQRSIYPPTTSNAAPEAGQHSSSDKNSSLGSARERLRPSRSLSNVRDMQVPIHSPMTSQMHHQNGYNTHDPMLRRSNTMGFSSPRGEPEGRILRRRATERASLRSNERSMAGADTWARLDRRERNRMSSVSGETHSGSLPVEEASQPKPAGASAEEAQDANVQSCVSSLMDMGYGAAHDGGRSRIAVYAAASNGNLLDAIEMIEEDRKAYARHGQL